MERYNKDTVCPKCGGDKLVNSYHPKGELIHAPNESHYNNITLPHEIIRQHCTNCNYEWDVKPIRLKKGDTDEPLDG